MKVSQFVNFNVDCSCNLLINHKKRQPQIVTGVFYCELLTILVITTLLSHYSSIEKFSPKLFSMAVSVTAAAAILTALVIALPLAQYSAPCGTTLIS